MLAPKRSYVPHRRRPKLKCRALHVTVHLKERLPNMREPKAYARIVDSIEKCQGRFGCQVTFYTVLSNHIHMIVEADDEKGLAQAMKGLLVRIAKKLNPLWGRMGSIFRERYHARILKSVWDGRKAIRYVLLNARKHGIWIPKDTPDPYSSAPWFENWLGRLQPFRSDRSPVAVPKTFCLIQARCFCLNLNEVPGRMASWIQECSWKASV